MFGKWEVDHIIELHTAKTESELLKLFHYTNQQPLWQSGPNIQKIFTHSGVNMAIVQDGKIVRKQLRGMRKLLIFVARTIQWSRGRQAKDSGIARQLNDEQPFRPDKLKAAGQDWRSNFSTGWLSSILYRAVPNYIQLIQNAEVLTRAELQDNTNPQNERISSQFQINFTKNVTKMEIVE